MRKSLALVLSLVLIFSLTSTGLAYDKVDKLNRGAINTVTGWVEVPKTMYEDAIEENVLSALLVGLGKGLYLGILRTAGGVYDIVTFPFDIPEGYVPILEPEFVFDKDEVVVDNPLVIDDDITIDLVNV